MGKGYALEYETEKMLLVIAEQHPHTPFMNRCHRVPTSGAHRWAKGDVLSVNVPFFERQIMIECKRRKHRLADGSMVFRLPEAWITKNEREAEGQGCLPFFLCAFTGAQSWRKFVVGRPKDMNEFLVLHYKGYPIILETNKKGTFIFNKKDMNKRWDESYKAGLGLSGKSGYFLVISYKFFVELLEAKKTSWLKNQPAT